MKMNKLKKFPVVQLMPHNMLQEIEVEVEIIVMTPKVHQDKVVMSIIWGIDYYKGEQVEVEVSHLRQERQAVLKQLPKVKNQTFNKSCLIKGLG